MGRQRSRDLDKTGCGLNFTTEPRRLRRPARARHPRPGHDRRHRQRRQPLPGSGPGVGTPVRRRHQGRQDLGAATIPARIPGWKRHGLHGQSAAQCGTPAPLVINLSGGQAGTGLTGTDVPSRKLDDKVWINRQVYVVAAGNEGPGAQTIRSPGVAKNALTVGNVYDNGYLTVGDIDDREQPGADRGRPHEAESRGTRRHRHLCAGGDHRRTTPTRIRHQHGHSPRHRARGHAHGALPLASIQPGAAAGPHDGHGHRAR